MELDAKSLFAILAGAYAIGVTVHTIVSRNYFEAALAKLETKWARQLEERREEDRTWVEKRFQPRIAAQ